MSFPGTTAPDYIRRRLRNGEGAGVILFGGNVVDAAGLVAVAWTRNLTPQAAPAANLPARDELSTGRRSQWNRRPTT
jgi:hypothetical protein